MILAGVWVPYLHFGEPSYLLLYCEQEGTIRMLSVQAHRCSYFFKTGALAVWGWDIFVSNQPIYLSLFLVLILCLAATSSFSQLVS